MPLTVPMCYERAVDVARSAGELSAADRVRLLHYLLAYSPQTADQLLARMIASRPELVATAMLDMRLDTDAAPAGYAYDQDTGEPVALEGQARLPEALAAAPGPAEIWHRDLH